jgi:hypothetical protein
LVVFFGSSLFIGDGASSDGVGVKVGVDIVVELLLKAVGADVDGEIVLTLSPASS